MITGGSYGGFMTLAVATNYNDRICCSVDVVGRRIWLLFLSTLPATARICGAWNMATNVIRRCAHFSSKIAPANKAKNITKPLFVIAGQNDPRVPESESAQMVQVVRQNGTPVWWLLGKDEGHGFAKKKNRDYQFYATVMFVKEYLLK
jgi:dipeptidyl aminopeptidase/acylaminoacyl peptidase